MNWKELWISLFGTVELFGLNMGFWVSMGAVTLLVVIMNVVFWSMKPIESKNENNNNKEKE